MIRESRAKDSERESWITDKDYAGRVARYFSAVYGNGPKPEGYTEQVAELLVGKPKAISKALVDPSMGFISRHRGALPSIEIVKKWIDAWK